MNAKYIEGAFPRYFVFGQHADGRVDVVTEAGGTVATVSPEHATQLIAQRDVIVQRLCDMAHAFTVAAPEAFSRFWYYD